MLLLLLARVSFFTEPLGISVDESTYMAIAEVLHQGGDLYVDAVDRKPPGLFWLYQAQGALFGPWNVHGLHGLLLLAILGLGVLAARSSQTRWGFWLYILFSSCLIRGVLAANAEYWMLLFLAPASYLAIEAFQGKFSPGRTIWVLTFATGLAAISCLFKQYGGFVYACIYLWGLGEFFLRSEIKNKFRIQALAAVGSAFSLALVFGLTSLYFWKNGSLSQFLYYFVLESFGYMGQDASTLNQQTKSYWILLALLGSWLPLFFFALLSWKKFRPSPWLRLWSLGFFAALLTAFFSGRHYTHYFVPAIWYLSVLAAPGVEKAFASLKKPKKVLLLGFLAFPYLAYAVVNTFQESFSSHWTFTKKRQFELEVLGNWIQAASKPEDRIVVWGMASQIYVYAQRGSATEFIFADFASGRLPGFKSSVSLPMPGAMEKYIRALEKKKPLYFVDTSTAKLNDYGAFPLKRFPKLESYLAQHYEKEVELMGYGLWRRRISQ